MRIIDKCYPNDIMHVAKCEKLIQKLYMVGSSRHFLFSVHFYLYGKKKKKRQKPMVIIVKIISLDIVNYNISSSI